MSDDKKKPTIEELKAILRQQNCRFRTVINPDGSIGSVLTDCGKEFELLNKLHEAAKLMGQSRKHDCPGWDCVTCNTTPVFEALNNLEEFYSPDRTGLKNSEKRKERDM